MKLYFASVVQGSLLQLCTPTADLITIHFDYRPSIQVCDETNSCTRYEHGDLFVHSSEGVDHCYKANGSIEHIQVGKCPPAEPNGLWSCPDGGCLLDKVDVEACKRVAENAKIFAGAGVREARKFLASRGDEKWQDAETSVVTAAFYHRLFVPSAPGEGKAAYDGINVDIRGVSQEQYEVLFGDWDGGAIALTMDAGQWSQLGEAINDGGIFTDILFHVHDQRAFHEMIGRDDFLLPNYDVSLVLRDPLVFDAAAYPWIRGTVIQAEIPAGSHFSAAFDACSSGS